MSAHTKLQLSRAARLFGVTFAGSLVAQLTAYSGGLTLKVGLSLAIGALTAAAEVVWRTFRPVLPVVMAPSPILAVPSTATTASSVTTTVPPTTTTTPPTAP